jgi:hypothetical protein
MTKVYFAWAAIALATLNLGCRSIHDYSAKPEAKEIIGTCYQFVIDMDLSSDDGLGIDKVYPAREEGAPAIAGLIGRIPTGTKVRIAKVVQYSIPMSLAPSISYATVGKIETGAFEGRLINLEGGGVSGWPPRADSRYVIPCPN